MSKELRKQLKEKATEFKYEPELTKKKARELYKIAMIACDRIDKLQADLNAYKAPKLYDKTEVNKIPERVYFSKAERAQHALDAGGEKLELYLKYSGLTLEEAKELVYKAKEVK